MSNKSGISRISPNEMRDTIRQSGYLLEQRVEPILTDSGFYVQINSAYLDSETGKTREIDINAIAAKKVYRKAKKKEKSYRKYFDF